QIPGALGVTLAEPQGVLINTVHQGSPAHEAGLMPGDLLVVIDGRPQTSVSQALQNLRNRSAGEPVMLGVVRGGRLLTLTAELAPQQAAFSGPPQYIASEAMDEQQLMRPGLD